LIMSVHCDTFWHRTNIY